jgi:hypothetical protein
MNPFTLPPDTFLNDTYKTEFILDTFSTQAGYETAIQIIEAMFTREKDNYAKLGDLFDNARLSNADLPEDFETKFEEITTDALALAASFISLKENSAGFFLKDLSEPTANELAIYQIIGQKIPSEITPDDKEALINLGFFYDFDLYLSGSPTAIEEWDTVIRPGIINTHWAHIRDKYVVAADRALEASGQINDLTTTAELIEQVSITVDAGFTTYSIIAAPLALGGRAVLSSRLGDIGIELLEDVIQELLAQADVIIRSSAAGTALADNLLFIEAVRDTFVNDTGTIFLAPINNVAYVVGSISNNVYAIATQEAGPTTLTFNASSAPQIVLDLVISGTGQRDVINSPLFASENVTIFTKAGNDEIHIGEITLVLTNNVTVNAGAGDDIIDVKGVNVNVDGEGGEDIFIIPFAASGELDGGADNDTFKIDYSTSIDIFGGAGTDILDLSDNTVELRGSRPNPSQVDPPEYNTGFTFNVKQDGSIEAIHNGGITAGPISFQSIEAIFATPNNDIFLDASKDLGKINEIIELKVEGSDKSPKAEVSAKFSELEFEDFGDVKFIDGGVGDDFIAGTSAAGGIALLGGEGDDIVYLGQSGPDSLIHGGAGNDWIIALGGEGVTTLGGSGKDFIFNTSKGGVIYGDTIDQKFENFSPEDDNSPPLEPDSDAESDMIWFWEGVTFADPSESDFLSFYGFPLVGGTSGLPLSTALSVGGVFAVGLGNYSPQAESLIYFDELFPHIVYQYDEGQGELKVTNLLTSLLGFGRLEDILGLDGSIIPHGTMVIKNYDNFSSTPFGWGLENTGDVHLSFKQPPNKFWPVHITKPAEIGAVI